MKEKKIKKNNLFISLCAIFIAVFSVFTFIPFTQCDNKLVKADTTYYDNLTFDSSNVIYACLGNSDNFEFTDFSGLLYNNASNPITSLDWLNFSFKLESNQNNLKFYIQAAQGPNYGIVPNNASNLYANNFYNTNTFNVNVSNKYLFNFEKFYFRVANSYYCTAIGTAVYNSNGLNSAVPTFKMYDIELGNYTTFNYIDDFNVSQYTNTNIVCYTDSAGFKYFFFIPCYQLIEVNDYMYYDYRHYYYDNALDLSDNDIYNHGYTGGYETGYNKGYDEGETSGYNSGYNIGQNVGYNSGYSAGSEDSNQYTFLNLISATIDAPIKYFQSLFNFELLGVNLQGFLTGLFTLCVIVTIIKMVL